MFIHVGLAYWLFLECITYYCIKSLQHAFNSHFSTGTYPCINKAIHVLLMHGFGTLNILVPGHYILQ